MLRPLGIVLDAIEVSDSMSDSTDGFSRLFNDSSEESSPTIKLIKLRAHCQEVDAQIREFRSDSKFNQVSLQKLKNERSHILEAIERIKDEMIPDLNA